jgi:hypothetical protein
MSVISQLGQATANHTIKNASYGMDKEAFLGAILKKIPKAAKGFWDDIAGKTVARAAKSGTPQALNRALSKQFEARSAAGLAGLGGFLALPTGESSSTSRPTLDSLGLPQHAIQAIRRVEAMRSPYPRRPIDPSTIILGPGGRFNHGPFKSPQRPSGSYGPIQPMRFDHGPFKSPQRPIPSISSLPEEIRQNIAAHKAFKNPFAGRDPRSISFEEFMQMQNSRPKYLLNTIKDPLSRQAYQEALRANLPPGNLGQ